MVQLLSSWIAPLNNLALPKSQQPPTAAHVRMRIGATNIYTHPTTYIHLSISKPRRAPRLHHHSIRIVARVYQLWRHYWWRFCNRRQQLLVLCWRSGRNRWRRRRRFVQSRRAHGFAFALSDPGTAGLYIVCTVRGRTTS
jgi:hypothetical protein